jgi:predicted protein tyrosine phosphatase
MTIIVSPISEIPQLLAARRPSHVLTLLSPETEIPHCGDIPSERHLTLLFHDIPFPMAGYIAPSRENISAILEFGSSWDRAAPMLVHCWAGISRSTAAAFILRCSGSTPGQEQTIAEDMRRLSPFASPNALMVALADEMLGREGRMRAAIAAIGLGTACSESRSFDVAF